MWQAQLEHFADYHSLLPDLPEHGQIGQMQPFGIQYSAASLGAQIGVALLGDRSVIASRITLLNGLIDIAAIRNGVLGI